MQRVFLNVGYELTEKQLRAHFSTFGVVSDLYLPKHSNGRNKGYGFATFASEKSLSLTLQQPEHIIDGVVVQVKRAGPRPPPNCRVPETKSLPHAVAEHVQPFGRGPRVYVGGVPDAVTEERIRTHFLKWGSVSDVYFPGSRGQKRSNYCFVTFDSQQNAERACNESERNVDGQPLESISMAEVRKDSLHQPDSYGAKSPLKQPLTSDIHHAAAPAGHAEVGKLSSYTEWLELQYVKQLELATAQNPGRLNATPPYSQANAQHTHHIPQAPAGLEMPYLHSNLDSPFANKQQVDNRFPWPVPPASPGFRSEQRHSYPTGSPVMPARADASGQSMEHMRLMAQLSMLTAASGSLGRQPADQAMRPEQYGGQLADQAMRPAQFGGQAADQAMRAEQFGRQAADQAMRAEQFGGRPADQTLRPEQFGSNVQELAADPVYPFGFTGPLYPSQF